METIRVMALEMGFYKGSRRRPGEEFDMDVADVPVKDAVYQFPSWVDAAGDLARRRFEKKQSDHAAKMTAGALASSGNGASGGAVDRKKESFAEATNRSHLK